MLEMCSHSHAHSACHSHYTAAVIDGMTGQACAADELIRADEKGDSVSVKIIFVDIYPEREILVLITSSLMRSIRGARRRASLPRSAPPLVLIRGCNFEWEMIFVTMQAEGSPTKTSDASVLDCTGILPTIMYAYVLATIEERTNAPVFWISLLSPMEVDHASICACKSLQGTVEICWPWEVKNLSVGRCWFSYCTATSFCWADVRVVELLPYIFGGKGPTFFELETADTVSNVKSFYNTNEMDPRPVGGTCTLGTLCSILDFEKELNKGLPSCTCFRGTVVDD